MSDSFNFEGASRSGADYEGRGASGGTGRHAFGLPAGSIRALLAFMILGLVFALMYLQREIPAYLQYLMFLMLGHFFAAHHKSIRPEREWSPLFLPRGAVRFLIFLGFAGIMGAIYYQQRTDVQEFVKEIKMPDERTKNLYMPVVIMIAFFIGTIAARFGRLIGGKSGQPGWYQDIEAWLVLMAMIGLAVVVIIELIVNPSLEAEGRQMIKLPAYLDQILPALVAFYFGARS